MDQIEKPVRYSFEDLNLEEITGMTPETTVDASFFNTGLRLIQKVGSGITPSPVERAVLSGFCLTLRELSNLCDQAVASAASASEFYPGFDQLVPTTADIGETDESDEVDASEETSKPSRSRTRNPRRRADTPK